MTIQPEGDNLRNAVKWISAQRQDQSNVPLSKLIDQASMAFNLTPLEADSLLRLLSLTTDGKK